jgi:hypothetical protein
MCQVTEVNVGDECVFHHRHNRSKMQTLDPRISLVHSSFFFFIPWTTIQGGVLHGKWLRWCRVTHKYIIQDVYYVYISVSLSLTF